MNRTCGILRSTALALCSLRSLRSVIFTAVCLAVWVSPSSSIASERKRDCSAQKIAPITIDAPVVGVTDGDTLKAMFSANAPYPGQQSVRLLEIDAPESGQAFGNRSKQKLSELAFGKTLRFTITGHDRFCRPLALVSGAEGNVNQLMVESGFAWFSREYGTILAIKRSEEAARAAKRGLFADPNPIYPGEWRKAKRQGNTDAVIGSR